MAEIPAVEGVVLTSWNKRFVKFTEDLLPPISEEAGIWQLRDQKYEVVDPKYGVPHDSITVSYRDVVPHETRKAIRRHSISFKLGDLVTLGMEHNYGQASAPSFLLRAGGVELDWLSNPLYYIQPNLIYLMQKRDLGHLRLPGQELPRGVRVSLVQGGPETPVD